MMPTALKYSYSKMCPTSFPVKITSNNSMSMQFIFSHISNFHTCRTNDYVVENNPPGPIVLQQNVSYITSSKNHQQQQYVLFYANSVIKYSYNAHLQDKCLMKKKLIHL